MQSKYGSPSNVELVNFVAAEIESLIASLDPSARKPALTAAGVLAGALVAAFLRLPRRKQFALSAKATELVKQIEQIIAIAAAAEPARESANSDQDRDAEHRRKNLPEFEPLRVQEWAGVVAGPTEIERRFGIPRSTLHRWQKLNSVIALKKGGRKFVFPLAQFVDGRPANGLSKLLEIIPHHRTAWLWLTTASMELGGRSPIELLRMDMVDDVLKAARDHYRSGG
jgi:hypothetical protein